MRADKNRPINGLLLDLDNTLYLYDPAHEAGIKSVFNRLHKKTSISLVALAAAYEQAKSVVKHRLQNTAASHHRLLYLQAMLEELQLFSATLTNDLYKHYWATFLVAMQPLPGMKEILPLLAKRYKIGIITNCTADIQYQKLEHLGIADCISHLITSEEIGCEKPDTKIFFAAFKKMQQRPEELCMIGDDLSADIIPAHQLGMETYWLIPTPTKQQSQTMNDNALFKTCSTFYDLEKRLQ
jgi:HAD superfamily hydrolase (TIGR01549 family)